MKNRTLKQIEKEYNEEQSKLLSLVVNPSVNMNEVREQKTKVDALYQEWLKMQSKITKMKGGK